MSAEVASEGRATVRIRVVLSASLIALSVGWAATVAAGPAEDLLSAASRGDIGTVQALLDSGTSVNARSSERCSGNNLSPVCDGATALIMSSYTGHLDVVQVLLARGADVNVKMYGGATALGMASLAGHPFALAIAPDSCRAPNRPIREIVRALLDKGADVNADNGGVPVLMMASSLGHLDVVQILLEKGANVNGGTGSGETALLAASGIGRLDIVQALLNKGGEVNAKTHNGQTALMLASFTGHLDVVRELLEKGADVNAKTTNYRTALMFASQGGHLDIVQALLDKGADVNFKTYDGMTALTVARNAEVKALLMQAGAKP